MKNFFLTLFLINILYSNYDKVYASMKFHIPEKSKDFIEIINVDKYCLVEIDEKKLFNIENDEIVLLSYKEKRGYFIKKLNNVKITLNCICKNKERKVAILNLRNRSSKLRCQ